MPRLTIAFLVLVCALFSASPAAAERAAPSLLPALKLSVPALTSDPRPSTGTGLIVAGWILTGIGVLNLAFIPACSADFYPPEAEDTCVAASAVLGGIGVALGVPFLIIGYNQRSDYKDWRERNSTLRHLMNARLAFRDDSALLLYRAEL
jgi:hypothetical protein